MRYCFLILIIIWFSFSGTAQVTIFPEVEKQDTRDIFIKKVEITDFYTIIDFYYRPRAEAWICAEKTFHIIPEGTRDVMYMVVAKNIKICPKKQKVGNFTEDLEFQIWFPKLRRNIYKIDVIEKARKGLNFYGVNIINGQEESIPDSSQYRSKEDFERCFGDNMDVFDPIEGIWKMESVISQYEDKKLIEIFNQDQVNQNNPCTAKYKDNYKVHVSCGKKKYSIDISSRPKEYLEQIYTSNGTVNPDYEPYIDSPNAIYPIKQIYNDAYQLLIQQRIVGIANADTLGIIQTLASLINSEFEVIYKGLLLFPQNLNNRKVYKKFNSKSPNSNKNTTNFF